jgi:hypothetical protein
MVRSAALASIVEPSTPIRSPFTRPRSATRFKTHPKTFSCASCGKRERVFDNQEWSGTLSRLTSRRKSRNE